MKDISGIIAFCLVIGITGGGITFAAPRVSLVESYNLPQVSVRSWALKGNELVILTSEDCSSRRISLNASGAVKPVAARSEDQWSCQFKSIARIGDDIFAISKQHSNIIKLKNWNDADQTSLFVLPQQPNDSKSGSDIEEDNDQVAYDGEYIYMVVRAGWSSGIWRLRQGTAEREFITYTSGNPVGIFWENGRLWYISNRTRDDYHAILAWYDNPVPQGSKNRKPTFESEIPCFTACGVYVEKGFVWCLDKKEHKMLKMIVQE